MMSLMIFENDILVSGNSETDLKKDLRKNKDLVLLW